jgi:hypothetical protein
MLIKLLLFFKNKSFCIVGHRWLMPVILAIQEEKIRRITVRGQSRQVVHEMLSQKYSTYKRAGKVAQVVESLPSKCEALVQTPIPPKRNKENKTKSKSCCTSKETDTRMKR